MKNLVYSVLQLNACCIFRLQRIACQENKEGPTYSSEIGLCQQTDTILASIPDPCIRPDPERVNFSGETHLPVYFDLETTGLGTYIHLHKYYNFQMFKF